jgi:hypothetical protein
MRSHGVSRTFAKKNFRRVVRAINKHPALRINYDGSEAGCARRANEFASRSTHPELFEYATAAIDGLCITIRCPKDVANQTKYYSGSKKKYCMNMQGVCDANCRFLLVTCCHVGSTNDGTAYATSSLIEWARRLPFPFHWLGDNAYLLSDYLVIPFLGVNLHIIAPSKESFNFWHSQLRITIERCFGIFVQRWAIFWKALRYDVDFVMEIVECCCRLHNFVQNDGMASRFADAITDIDRHVARVNESGVLADREAWGVNEPVEYDWRSSDPVCPIRAHITEKIEQDPRFLRVRSHHLAN